MKKIISAIAVSGLCVIMLAAPSVAGARHGRGRGMGPGMGMGFGPGHGMRMFSPERIEFIAYKLGLEKEVVDTMKAKVADFHLNTRSTHQKIRSLHQELRQIMEAATIDKEAALDKVEALGQLKTDFHKNRLLLMVELRSLLTPEQQAQFKQMRNERRQQWRERRFRGPGRGMGKGMGNGPGRGMGNGAGMPPAQW